MLVHHCSSWYTMSVKTDLSSIGCYIIGCDISGQGLRPSRLYKVQTYWDIYKVYNPLYSNNRAVQ